MPAFRYEAIETNGQTKTGVVNADSARAARSELRAQGFTPIFVEQIASEEKQKGRKVLFADHLSSVELSLFTRQLASLLEAGLPLEQ